MNVKLVKGVFFSTLMAGLGTMLGFSAFAQNNSVSVKNAWARATVGPQKSTGAFMQIECKTALNLIRVESDAAAMVEIHEMKMDSGVMKMREVEKLECASGKPLELSPGGFHVMLMNVHKPVKVGDQVQLQLVFEDKQAKQSRVKVLAPAKAVNATMH